MKDFEDAKSVYSRVRRKFPDREIPNTNVEGQPWFTDDDGCWSRNTPDGSRGISICLGRHGKPYVAVKVAHDGEWYTEERLFDDL